MADEQPERQTSSATEEEANVPLAYDINIPDVYSNNSEILLGPSDITIAFLQNIDFEGKTRKGLVRVVMTHASFMQFVSYCNTRAKLLETIYDGRPRTLLDRSIADEDLKKAIDNMWSGKKVEAKFEFVDTEDNAK